MITTFKKIVTKVRYFHKDVNIIDALRKRGVQIGENVDIIDSFIDYGHGRLISIGNNVTITGARILSHDASTKKFIGYSKIGFVRVGNNVFIGNGAIILPGTTIGDNVIIGAGTVIASDVPNNSVMIGNPARKLCSFNEYIQKNLSRLKSDEAFVSDIIFRNRNQDQWEELKSNLKNKSFGFDL